MNKETKEELLLVLIIIGGIVLAIAFKIWPKEVRQAFTILPYALKILVALVIIFIVIGILYFIVRFLIRFFENQFRKRFVPTPTQDVPGIEPIIVHAIENLFPNIDDQKYAFDYVLKLQEKGRAYDTKIILALLSGSNGNVGNLLDVNSPLMGNYRYMEEMIVPIFPRMKDAEEWVKSITKL